MGLKYGKILVLEDLNTDEAKGTSKWMTASMCLAFSVVLHVVIAVMICLRMIMLDSAAVEAPKATDKKEDAVISIRLAPEKQPEPIQRPKTAPLTPAELKALVAKPEPKPKPTPEDVTRIARTSVDQLTGEVPETNLEGERDTIAASNADAVISGVDRPSVSGEKSKDDRQEMVDTTFQDGMLEHMNKGAESAEEAVSQPTQVPNEAQKTAIRAQEEMKSNVVPTADNGEELDEGKLAETNKNSKELLDTEKKVALNNELANTKNRGESEKEGLEEKNKTIANKQVDPNAIKQKAQKKKSIKKETLPKNTENKRASKAAKKGFRSEAKATIMEGTISRRSKIASQNVKSTPVGKYMAEISKLVEQEWQRRMMMHADLIEPGNLRIRFMVDERGKVKHPDIISQNLGSKTQESLTFQALMSAKIPPMPAKVKELQGGDLLEFRYYFNFQ